MPAKFDDPLTQQIIGLAMKVHRTLGTGFLEVVYQRALLIELRAAGLRADADKRVRAVYDGVPVGDFVVDILVDDKILLELKAVESLAKAHEIQTVNYLTATSFNVGLVINFGSGRLQFKRKFRQPRADPVGDEADPKPTS
jgi:GxxExxY protein